jgi:hypothetical protein
MVMLFLSGPCLVGAVIPGFSEQLCGIGQRRHHGQFAR